ncbi:NPCBM/NEW2 domain-containing protein [Nocardiopsis valliformis]|uniref:NPCBM/NEW2 domain-containing protein n=1 Tax=Nocardiopsis valliformis TaxID=239974 RepID=UPI0003603A53|nr:NPCBM/NEW2 domain-containing protein [Nocardiopsis valliformis]
MRHAFYLIATGLLWLLATLGLIAWLLWIGGGATEASSWEFFSWVTATPVALFIAWCALATFLTKAIFSSVKMESSTPWPQRQVSWSWASIVLLVSILLILAAVAGGAAQHWALQTKESRADGTDSETIIAGIPTQEPSDSAEGEEAPEDEDAEEPDQRSEEASSDGGSASPTSSPDSAPEEESLLKLETTTSGHRQDSGTMQVAGETYAQTVYLKECVQCSMEYNLGKDWTTFTALIGLSSDSPEGAQITFLMYVDSGDVLSHTLSRGETEEITIDVEGAQYLKLEAERVGPARGVAVWADPTVLR